MSTSALATRTTSAGDSLPWLALLDASPDAIIVASQHGDFLHLNKATSKLLTHVEPRPCWSHLIHTEDFPAFMRWLLAPGESLFRARLAKHPAEVWEWSHGEVPHEGTILLTGRQVVTDATAITRAPTSPWLTQRPTQNHNHVRRLCGHLAHRFNNMLASIIGNLELTLQDLDAASVEHEMLEDARIASRHAAHLTQRLLDASTSGRFHLTSVSLSEWMQGVLDERNLDLEVETSWDTDALVRADFSQLSRAMIELLDNVEQARATHLRIDTRLVDHEVVLRLKNDGNPLPPRILSWFGVPFPPAPTAGDGLGLAVVDGVMRGHNGSLNVTHIPGEGACVELTFPRAPETSVTSTDRPA